MDHMITLCLTLWGLSTVLQSTATCYVHTGNVSVFQFLHILASIYYYLYTCPVKWYFIVMICISWWLLMLVILCLLAIFVSSLYKCLFSSFLILKYICPFILQLYYFFIYSRYKFFYYILENISPHSIVFSLFWWYSFKQKYF